MGGLHGGPLKLCKENLLGANLDERHVREGKQIANEIHWGGFYLGGALGYTWKFFGYIWVGLGILFFHTNILLCSIYIQ